ncbi:ribosome biogenesis GTPase YqeH [Fusobacterium sp. PH5-44]|uniref:ribosome biogenesis GTPase YqeH n=1 Tax=unclassified Fusobacterium TaxID=2648384 RepID=UPI003D238F26
MKKVKKCIGCGIELQCIHPKENGYIIAEKLETGGDLYCERCYKIKHYGKYIPVVMDKDDYKAIVEKSLENCKVAIAVLDIIEFEGSFDDEILDILREIESIVVVNKLDIVPNDMHPSKVADWVKKRLGEEGISPLDIAIVSSKNNYGINGIYKKLKHFYPNGVKVLVLGATNVGKSSIVNKLLGTKRITESKYPGTTLKLVSNKIPMTNIEIVDTPGLIPDGRISDLVCESCNLKIIPTSKLQNKIFKLGKDRMLLLERLLWIRVLNDDELKPIFTMYTSPNIKYHETNMEKGLEIFSGKVQGREILDIPCEKCILQYKKNVMEKRKITVETGEDLVFKGLGWLNVKRGPLYLEVYLPKEAETVIREAFIK